MADDLFTTDLIAGLPPDVVEHLWSRATVRQLERGDIVFRQGDEAAELYVVQEGRVAIATQSPDGRESVVAVLESGSLFGELPLFDEAPRSANARAVQPTRLIAVAYDDVRAVLDQRPTLLWSVARLLASRLRATDEALADAVFLDVPGRTAKRILELAAGADEFTTPLTQEELAAMIGASRERVNKALATFQRLGWIEVLERGHYRLLDRTSLERRASM